MSYKDMPTQTEKIPAKWKLTFTRTFWRLFFLGIVLFIVGWLLGPVFPPRNDGRWALSELIQWAGIVFFVVSFILLTENSGPRRTKPKLKRPKSFWVFWSLGVMSLILGLTLLVTVGHIGMIFIFGNSLFGLLSTFRSGDTNK